MLSNSPEVEPVPLGDGLARWEFAPTPPISTYITALVAGSFHTVRDGLTGKAAEIPLSVLCRQSLVEHLDADRILATTKAGFEVFEEHFGMPYPFADYAQVFVPEFNAGAMENAGCVTIRDEYLYRVARHAGRLRDPRQHDPARAGPHVVRRPRHHDLVGRPLAQRIVRGVGFALLPGRDPREGRRRR